MAWIIGAVWLAWLAIVVGTGYAPPATSGDRVDERATSVSVVADLVMLTSLAAAVALALLASWAALPGTQLLWIALGAALVAAGLALRAWSARALGRFFTRSVLVRAQHTVVTDGPYRVLRHPAYAGMLLCLLGLGLTLANWLSLLVVAVGFFVAHVPRILAEEAALEAALGDAYRDYSRGRKRVLPGVW